MDQGMWRLAMVMVAALAPMGAPGQSPAAIEDARIERERLLRAADQLEFLTTQTEGLRGDVAKLRSELDALRAESETQKRIIQEMTAAQAAERQKLLDEVSQIVAKSKPTPAPGPSAAPAAAPAQAGREKGYVHKVEKGQTVTAIARAYSAKGVKVDIEDIVKANNLGPDARVRPGQELFIPKKD